jgi:hypothetical protein
MLSRGDVSSGLDGWPELDGRHPTITGSPIPSNLGETGLRRALAHRRRSFGVSARRDSANPRIGGPWVWALRGGNAAVLPERCASWRQVDGPELPKTGNGREWPRLARSSVGPGRRNGGRSIAPPRKPQLQLIGTLAQLSGAADVMRMGSRGLHLRVARQLRPGPCHPASDAVAARRVAPPVHDRIATVEPEGPL